MRESPPESFSLVSDVLMVVEEVLEALLSVLDGAEEEERDEAEVLPKGEADPPLEDSEEAAPKIEVLFVELPLKTEDEVVGTLEVAKEKLVADDALMEEVAGAAEKPLNEEPPTLFAGFPSPDAPGTAGDPPKIEVPGEGFTWLSKPDADTGELDVPLDPPKVPILEIKSLAGDALLSLLGVAGELVFDLANALNGELLAVSPLLAKMEESGVEDFDDISSLLMISTISGVADFAFSSFGAPKLSDVEEAVPPNPPIELLIGVIEKPEVGIPKPREAVLDPKAGGAKFVKAGFAWLPFDSGFSGFGSAGDIGSYVGGFEGVTKVLVETWVERSTIALKFCLIKPEGWMEASWNSPST